MITKNDVKKIAELSKLEFAENELEEFTHEMNSILDYVEKLNELNTENIKPLSHPIESSNVFREDELKISSSTEDALKNAPNKTSEYFKVPKVISQNK